MEKISNIKEADFKHVDSKGITRFFEGFIITTNKQEIKLGIESNEQCCEKWGYFMTEDNLKEFENSKLFQITFTDKSFKTQKIEDIEEKINSDQILYCVFINIMTDKGKLQFTAYNAHNGHYGHKVIVISEDLNLEQNL